MGCCFVSASSNYRIHNCHIIGIRLFALHITSFMCVIIQLVLDVSFIFIFDQVSFFILIH